MRLSILLLASCSCAAVPPSARTVSALADHAEVMAVWRELGGKGEPPPVVFMRADCDDGFWDSNGLGCVRGEHIGGATGTGVCYVAELPTWRETLRHELLHALIGDPGHTSSRWVIRDGYYMVKR